MITEPLVYLWRFQFSPARFGQNWGQQVSETETKDFQQVELTELFAMILG